MADERDLADFALKAGDLSVRVEAGKVTAHAGGKPVSVKSLTLSGGEGHFTLAVDHDPAPGEAQAESPPPGGASTVGPTGETAPPSRPAPAVRRR